MNLIFPSPGTSGSGKTYASMLLLRQLFDVAGGGPETDAFKHLAAAFTVLRSLGSAKTATNSESSRIVSLQPGRETSSRILRYNWLDLTSKNLSRRVTLSRYR